MQSVYKLVLLVLNMFMVSKHYSIRVHSRREKMAIVQENGGEDRVAIHEENYGKTTAFSWALHTSDQPGMILVSTPLNVSNFLTWSTALKILLNAKEKVGFVVGSLQPPTDEEGLKVWSKTNKW